MSLSDSITLDENIEYTPLKNKLSLEEQYNNGVLLNRPFFIKHYEKINGRKRLKYWYFNRHGVSIVKKEYKHQFSENRHIPNWYASTFIPGQQFKNSDKFVTHYEVTGYQYIGGGSHLNSYVTVHPNNNIEYRSTYGDGNNESKFYSSIRVYDQVPQNLTIEFGFFASIDGSDLNTTDKIVTVGLDENNNFYTKNYSNNTITIFYQIGSRSILNMGLCFDKETGQYFVLDSGYFLLSIEDIFQVDTRMKIFPFIKINGTGSPCDILLNDDYSIYYQGINFFLDGAKVLSPSTPTYFKLPDPLIPAITYRVASADQYSVLNGYTFSINDLVVFSDEHNFEVLPR